MFVVVRLQHTHSPTISTLSEAQFLLLFLFLANHFHVAVLPHALPQFDGTTADIFPWTHTHTHSGAAVINQSDLEPGKEM